MGIQEKLIRLELDSGEVALVRRLSPFARQAFNNQAEKLYPSPDKKQYEKPLSEIVPNAMPGVMAQAEDNPDYVTALQEAKYKQAKWFNDAVLEAGAVADTEEGREVTIERYRGRIQQLRNLVDVPADEWMATVLYGLITTHRDRTQIVRAAIEILTSEEIRVAMHAFRG